MTVTADSTVTETTFTTTDPATQAYTPSAAIEGVAVAIVHTGTATDLITDADEVVVDYGGVKLERVAAAFDSATEPGRAMWYFGGKGLPTGTQTVTVRHTGSSDVKHMVIVGLHGADDLEVIDTDQVNNNAANPSVVLNTGSRTALRLCAIMSGITSPASLTLLSGMTAIHDHGFGSACSRVDRETTASSGAGTTMGYTSGTDDVAFSAIAVSEVQTKTWWQEFWVAPTGMAGLSGGGIGGMGDLPFQLPTTNILQQAGSATTVVIAHFDLSLAPGDKKGFGLSIWYQPGTASGLRIDDVEIFADGTSLGSTGWTGTNGPNNTTTANHQWLFLPIPDSLFSGDPNLDDLDVKITFTNVDAGTSNHRIGAIILSKSPFTSAEEYTLPAALDGQPFMAYRATDLGNLGAADAEAVMVWPDASGGGCHAIRRAGSGAVYQVDTPEYVESTVAARLASSRGWDWSPTTAAALRVTGNHGQHALVYPTENLANGIAKAIISVATEVFDGITSVTDKCLLAYEDAAGVERWLIMDGDGTGAAHIRGATDVVRDTWTHLTHLIQNADNDMLWLDDNPTPDIDAAGSASANNWLSTSIFDRETDDRPFLGRIQEIVRWDHGSLTEADVIDAADEWVNGAGDDRSGGSEATVQFDAEGAGTKAVAGNSEADVDFDAEGAGRKAANGGSTAVVVFDAEGAGTPAEPTQGGSTAVVQFDAEGAGRKAAQGGSTAIVTFDGEGAGIAAEPGQGGSTATVTFDGEGAGIKAVSGGSTAVVTFDAEGGGESGSRSGGSTAVVTFDAEGAGTVFDPFAANIVPARYQNVWCRGGPRPVHWPTRVP